MRELLVLNICVCLACCGVALLVWWAADEWVRRPAVKVLARHLKPVQPGGDRELDKLSVGLPLPGPEFALKGAPLPLGR